MYQIKKVLLVGHSLAITLSKKQCAIAGIGSGDYVVVEANERALRIYHLREDKKWKNRKPIKLFQD